MTPLAEYTNDRRIAIRFTADGEFEALHAAEAWLTARGFSVGRWQAHEPCGVLFGSYDIQKWRNLNMTQRAALHAIMTGDGKHGPIIVRLLPLAPGEAGAAFGKEDVTA